MRKIPFGKPLIGEQEKKSVLEVLDCPTLVHGPRAEAFEKAFVQFTGSPFAISVSSCTAALHLGYLYLKIGPGDQVIVPAQTHVATAHAVELCGAKPVFVDAELETGNIDIDQIKAKITKKTKAISVVHFLGMPVDMAAVTALARRHSLFVVEDCALAIGSYYQGIHAGLHGDIGCFSFYPVKHMTTAEGGMVITRSEEVAKSIRLKKAFGVDRAVQERSIPGIYDVKDLGLNYRMNEIQAAIGIEQLKRVPDFLAQRKKNDETLRALLSEVEDIQLLKSTQGEFQSSYYCLSIILNDSLAAIRQDVIKFLNERGVGTSVYYPRPVSLFSYYQKKYGYEEKDFPVASKISRNSIALPVGPHLRMDDMEYIAEAVKEAVAQRKCRS